MASAGPLNSWWRGRWDEIPTWYRQGVDTNNTDNSADLEGDRSEVERSMREKGMPWVGQGVG